MLSRGNLAAAAAALYVEIIAAKFAPWLLVDVLVW